MSDGGFGYSGGGSSVYSGDAAANAFTQSQTAQPAASSVVTNVGSGAYQGNYASGSPAGYSGGQPGSSSGGSSFGSPAGYSGGQPGSSSGAMGAASQASMGYSTDSVALGGGGANAGFPSGAAQGAMMSGQGPNMGILDTRSSVNPNVSSLMGGLQSDRTKSDAFPSGTIPASASFVASSPGASDPSQKVLPTGQGAVMVADAGAIPAALQGQIPPDVAQDPSLLQAYLQGYSYAQPMPGGNTTGGNVTYGGMSDKTTDVALQPVGGFAATYPYAGGVEPTKFPGMTGDRATGQSEVDLAAAQAGFPFHPSPLLGNMPTTPGGSGAAVATLPATDLPPEQAVITPSGRARLAENPTSPTSALGEAARSNAFTVAQTPAATDAGVPTPQVRPGTPNLKAGSTDANSGGSGSEVTSLQQQLVNAGYLKQSQVDGVYGSQTAAAVKKLEADPNVRLNGARLTRDTGVAGPQVTTALRTVPTAGPSTGLVAVTSEPRRTAIKGNALGSAQVPAVAATPAAPVGGFSPPTPEQVAAAQMMTPAGSAQAWDPTVQQAFSVANTPGGLNTPPTAEAWNAGQPAVAAGIVSAADILRSMGDHPPVVTGVTPAEAALPPGGGEIPPAVPAPGQEAIPVSTEDLPKAPTHGAVKATASAQAAPLNQPAPENPDQTKQQYTKAQANAAKKGEVFWGYDQSGNRVLYRKQ